MRTRPAPASLHERLRARLQEDILAGRCVPGEFLPSERELCAAHGVSRITVVRALNDLAQLGMVRRLHGRGTMVTRARMSPALGATLALTETAQRMGQVTAALLLEREEADGAELPPPLPLRPGERFLRVLRLRRVGDTPAVLTTSWIPAELAARLPTGDLEDGSLHAALSQATGRPMTRHRQVIAPIAATERMARLLRVPAGSSHFLFTGVAELEGAEVAEFSQTVYHGLMFEFSLDMHRDPAGAWPLDPGS